MSTRWLIQTGAGPLAALLLLLGPTPPVHAAQPVVVDGHEDEPDLLDGGSDQVLPSPGGALKPNARPTPPSIKPRPTTAPAPVGKPVPSANSKPTPLAKPAPASDDDSEAAGPDAEEHCRTCGPSAHKDPGTPNLVDAVLDTIRGHSDPLKQTGSRMSCAQRQLLEAARDVNARWPYKNRGFSRGDCGGGVGKSILAAGLPFEHGPPSGPSRLAKNYRDFCPKWHFEKTAATREEDAPEGSVLVYGGPLTEGLPRGTRISPECRNRARVRHPKPGVFNGHVTIKGSPSLDGGEQWYYTDGRTREPAIPCRYFLGAYLPPGSEKGPAPTDGKGHFACN